MGKSKRIRTLEVLLEAYADDVSDLSAALDTLKEVVVWQEDRIKELEEEKEDAFEELPSGTENTTNWNTDSEERFEAYDYTSIRPSVTGKRKK